VQFVNRHHGSDRFPVSAAREDCAMQLGTFESSIFKDDSTVVSMSTVTNMLERFHIALEVEEELKKKTRED